MLDNLVESKNNSRAARKFYGFLFSTFLVVSIILLSATVWSLFAKDFTMGESDLELSNLLAPIAVENDQPKPEKPEKQNEPQTARNELPNRQTLMARTDEAQIAPDKVSTTPNTNKARPNTPFTFNPKARDTDGSFSTDTGRGRSNGDETGFKNSDNQSTVVETVKTKVPPPPPPVEKKADKIPPVVTGGVVNGKASYLPKPPYPAPAKAVNASGAVNVQVTIDEAGNVISAKAVTGHPLLRQAAEDAARKAKFTPTYLSKTAVKVNGLIVYNFTR